MLAVLQPRVVLILLETTVLQPKPIFWDRCCYPTASCDAGFGDVEAIASKLAPICRLAATLQAPPAGSGFNAGEAGNAAVLAVVHQAAALRRRLGSHQATESGLVACSLGSLVLPGLELSQAAAFERQLQKAFPGDDALFKVTTASVLMCLAFTMQKWG